MSRQESFLRANKRENPEQILYSCRAIQDLLIYHRSLTSKNNQGFYFEYTDKQEQPLLEIPITENSQVTVGRIGWFMKEQIALLIQEQTVQYVRAGTMGKTFPVDDQQAIDALMRTMVHGFSPEKIIVLYEYTKGERRLPLGGVAAHKGMSDSILRDIVFPEGKSSSLSTFQSVRINPDCLTEQIISFLEEYGQVPENQVYCLSRLFRQPKQIGSYYNDSDVELPWLLMSALGIGIVKSVGNSGSDFPLVAVYDTHSSVIQQQLERIYGMNILGRPGDHTETDEVQQSILAYHYSNDGYLNDLVTGFISIKDYFLASRAFLVNRGISLQDAQFLDEKKSYERHSKEQGLEHVVVEGYGEVFEPRAYKPIIIDPKTSRGQDLLKELENNGIVANELIYTQAKAEIVELRQAFSQLECYPDKLMKQIVEQLASKVSGVSAKNIQDLLEYLPIVNDLAWLVSKVKDQSDDGISADSRYLYFPGSSTVFRYIGQEAHRLLLRSRLLGIIPFESLDKLQKLKISSAGASAVVRSLDLLTALGAEKIHFFDTGIIAPSNLPRFMGGMGSVTNIGTPKVIALMEQLYLRNPYGDYQGMFGHVVPTEKEKRSPFDISFCEFFSSADIVFEVVDNPKTKIQLRLFRDDNQIKVPIIFLADTAYPFVGIEELADRDPFHQQIGYDQLNNLLQKLEATGSPRHDLLRSVFFMLANNFTSEHQLQFLLNHEGYIPYWSQTPISADESAAIAGRLIIQLLQGEVVSGRNVHPNSAPVSLVGLLNDQQQQTLAKLLQSLLDV